VEKAMTSQTPEQSTAHYDFTGRVALVPGGLGGAGRAVTLAFLSAGAQVVAVEHRSQSAENDSFREQLGDLAAHLRVYPADVTDESEVESLVQAIVAEHQKIDILINLVGGWMAGEPITNLALRTWEHMLDLNLKAAFLLSKHVARTMIQTGWGRIIHISSRGAVSGRRNAAAYAIAKNAVVTLVEIQAEELQDTHITVNAILPSIIDTPANRAGMPNSDFSRWPKPEEVARVLLFLASDDAGLISGAAIPVYGRA
jgi:NAD(P)-dependent dehydrogenase (short-subunit alcohol dehydrogenase family)